MTNERATAFSRFGWQDARLVEATCCTVPREQRQCSTQEHVATQCRIHSSKPS